MPDAALAAYLSGMLIGREIIDLAPKAMPVHLIGATRLVALYARALRRFGHTVTVGDPDCVADGLFRLAGHLPGTG